MTDQVARWPSERLYAIGAVSYDRRPLRLPTGKLGPFSGRVGGGGLT